MKSRNPNRRNSGQVLIIASLVVTLLLLSTAIYVSEIEKNAAAHEARANPAVSAYKLGVTHTVISALANISNGGSTNVLAEDLNQFETVVNSNSFNAIVQMDFTPLNTTPYQDGIWISSDAGGRGISSAYVSLVLNSSGTSATYYSEYAINVTSEINVNGYYTLLTGSLKQVNVICNVLNEGKPALAQNFTVYYEQDGSLSPEEWVQVASPSITDYGNGTYVISFTAETTNPEDPMLVSVYSHDLRYILTKANVTCTQV
ncbi:hypothetical protein JXA31_03720 [Candidatus Bathyarchaeota archaeon]|nr:hypothetical protein [Candidatus Bathyarchaeota archaeon]